MIYGLRVGRIVGTHFNRGLESCVGFVNYATIREAGNALDRLNRKEIRDRSISVCFYDD